MAWIHELENSEDTDSLSVWELAPWSVRESLLAAMSRVMQNTGWEPLLRAPILDESCQWFPDPWSQDSHGIRVMIRRLLSYVGLEEADVSVEVKRAMRAKTFSQQGHGMDNAGACAWFLGWNGSTCRFGVDLSELDHPESLVGTLAHEVCHAYRSYHQIAALDRAAEERLTDVTAVVLGFGVLLLNSAYQFQSNRIDRGGNAMSVVSQRGYLSPSEIAWLLAVQIDARQLNKDETKRILRALQPNQRQSLESSQAEILADPEPVRGLMGVPSLDHWPCVRQVLVVPLPDLPRVEDETVPSNFEAPVVAQLVVHSRVFLGLILSASLFACSSYFVYDSGAIVAVAFVASCVAGVLTGYAFPRRSCSNCKHVVGRKAEQCSHCQAIFSDCASVAAVEEGQTEESEWLGESEEHQTMNEAKAAFVQWAWRRDLVLEEVQKAHESLTGDISGGMASENALLQVLSSHPNLTWMSDLGHKFAKIYSRNDWALLLQDWMTFSRLGASSDVATKRQRFESWLDYRRTSVLVEDSPVYVESPPQQQQTFVGSYPTWDFWKSKSGGN